MKSISEIGFRKLLFPFYLRCQPVTPMHLASFARAFFVTFPALCIFLTGSSPNHT
jgi:hypothetical protein